MSITQNPTIDPTERDIFVYYLTGGSAVFGCVGDPEGLITANRNSLAISNNGNVYTKTTDGVSTGWQVVGGGGGTGTVTSVGLTVPGVIFTSPVSGSPVTTSGTLALTLATQGANRVFAGPSSGPDATPTFRALTSADLALAAAPPAGGIQFNDGANAFTAETDFLFDAASGTLQIGVVGTRSGRIQLRSLVSGSTTLTVDTPSSAHVIAFPNALPSTNDLLRAAAVSGSNVTWGYVAPSALGFPTINATDGVIPYRSSSSAFSDSPIVRNGANDISIGNIGSFAGLQIVGAAAGSGLGMNALSSGASEDIRFTAKGTGKVVATRNGGIGLGLLVSGTYIGLGRNSSIGGLNINGSGTDSDTAPQLNLSGTLLKFDTAIQAVWSNTNVTQAAVVGIGKLASGVLRVSDGSTGAGKLAVGSSTASTANQFLVDSQGTTVIAGFFSMPGSSTVATIKAETSSVQSFAFFPSGKLQGGCNIPTSNQQFSALGNLKSDVSEVGNVGTGTDNLLSFGYSAKSIANNGDSLTFIFTVVFANNANNKQVEATFGGVSVFLISDTYGAAGQSQAEVIVRIRRTSSTTAKCTATLISSDTLLRADCQYNEITTDFAAGQTFQITGTATATDDIICKQLESNVVIAQTS